MTHATILRPVDTETKGTLIDPNRAPRLLDPTNNSTVALLREAYDVVITDELINGSSQGQEVLDFKLPFHATSRDLIQTEMVIEVGGSRFHVRTPWDGWDEGSPVAITSVHCEALWYLLGEADPITMVKQTDARTALGLIIGNTGWTIGTVDVPANGGSLTIVDKMSPLAALRLLPQAFGGELEFDSIAKTVGLRAQRGSSAVVALYAHGRNLSGNSRTEDTTNLVTRLYVIGAQATTPSGDYVVNPDGTAKYIDISSVNGGLTYLEDYSFYQNRGLPDVIRAATVQADTITDPATLKAWGQAQLAAMCQPTYTYQIQQSNTGVNDVEVQLGDVVRVHDDDLGLDINARIQGRVRNITQPWLSKYTVDAGLFTLSNALVGVGGGTVTGGGGASATDSSIPNAPASVSIVATATTADYGALQMQIEASWAQVTGNTDSTPISDLDHYEVQYQLTTHDYINNADVLSAWNGQNIPVGSTSALITITDQKSLRITVRVRAVDVHGNASAWTTQGPQVIGATVPAPPSPSAPTAVATALPGVSTVHWDGNAATGPMPADVIRLDVHVGSTSGFTPTAATLVDQLTAAGNSVLSLQPGTWYIRFIAVNSSLLQSAPSASLAVTPRQVVGTDILNATIKSTNLSVQLGTGNLQQNAYYLDTTHVAAQGGAVLSVPAVGTANYQGDPVLQVVAVGGGTAYSGMVQNDKVSVQPNQPYSTSVWLFNPGASALTLYTRWSVYTAAVGFIREVDTSVTLQPGVWTRVTNTFTADATAGLAQFSTQWTYGAIPAAGNYTYYMYGLTITRGDLPVDASRIVVGSIAASAVRAENLAAGAIQAVSIDVTNGKINSAQIGSVSVGSLVAGTLVADATVSARIKTADTGARAEMSGTGFYLIDGNGNQLLAAKIISGVASIDIIGNIKAGSSLPITTYTEQLLPNGTFEDLDLNGFPQYWVLDSGTGVGSSESANPMSGSRSFTISVTGNTQGAGYRSTKYVPVTAGERLVAKIDVRINGTPVAGQNGIYLRIHWRNAAGALITGSAAPLPISPQILTVDGAYVATPATSSTAAQTDIANSWTGWTAGTTYRIVGEVTVPTGAVYADLAFYAWSTATVGGAATYTFDNAYLARSGVGNSIRSGYVTGAWLRTGETGKRMEMGTDRGAAYAYNVMYFYTGWTANGVGESIDFGPFYPALYSHPMQGYIAVDVATPTGGTSPTGQMAGTIRLQSPKITADTATDTYAALMVSSTILDTSTGALVADSDAVRVQASKFYFDGNASGEHQVRFRAWSNNTRIALWFDAWGSSGTGVLTTTTGAGQYQMSGGTSSDMVLSSRVAGSRVGISTVDGGGGTWFLYAGSVSCFGSQLYNIGMNWATDGSVHVANFLNTNYATIRAAAFTVVSASDTKHVIAPLKPGWARGVIKGAPSYRWKYVPGEFHEFINDGDRKRSVKDPDHLWHFGPMWEDVDKDVRGDDEALDLRDLVGVLWAGLDEAYDEIDRLKELVSA